jgi:sigma-B regulation protein RsbU (phosphoserine phosphatase)
MSLERYLPRSLRARFTLLTLACTGIIFLCTAPLVVWQGQQLLFERNIHDIQNRLDATVSKGDAELRAIRQQALGMTDVAEQWDDATVEWINLKKNETGSADAAAQQKVKGLDAWFEYMEFTLRRLPKAYGVRLAFEPHSELGPAGVRSLYVRWGDAGKLVRTNLEYLPDDSESPGSRWYVPLRESATEAADGVWSEPFTAGEATPETVITCSVPIIFWKNGKTSFDGVAAVDVTIEAIIETLRKLDLAPEFEVFILNPSRRVTVSAQGGTACPDAEKRLQVAASANPDAFLSFTQLQNPANPTGWFVGKNPYTGVRSCFFFERLPHNASQLLYVIPLRALETDIFWLAGSVVLLGLVSIVGMGLLIRWSAGLVTSNLDVLRKGVQNVRAGNLREMLPPATAHDETADIIGAFNGMVGELQSAFQLTEDLARRQQRAATELELARSIQQSALPSPIWFPGGRIFSTTLPAQEVGGDFYDAFDLPGGRAALALGDVSGKGVSAALFMVRASLLLRSAAAATDPQDAITQMNGMLVKSNPEMMFVTLFFAVWDPLAEKLTCVNAGHNPPIIVRADGSFERLARRSGPAIGAMSGQVYPSWEIPFSDGDLLAVYTDGITEAPDAAGTQFGEERLRNLLPDHRESHLDELAQRVVADVSAWQGGLERFDDITLLLARSAQPPARLELPASPETIEAVVSSVETCALKGGMAEPAAREFSLAACEAVTNVITHSLGSNPSRSYRVFIGWSGDQFMVRIEDDGPPFDPDSLPQADLRAPLADRPIGGLGWVLIRRATDSVRMDRIANTNILTLNRSLNRPTTGQAKPTV